MDRWRMTRDGHTTRLARLGSENLEFGVETRFPPLRAGVLAHEIRKDLWRSLRGLRGFSPVIEVVEDDLGMTVTAGGQVVGKSWPRQKTLTEIDALLSNPVKRARWIAHARIR